MAPRFGRVAAQVTCVAVVLAGCGTSTEAHEQTTPALSVSSNMPSPGPAPADLDIARLAELAVDFPPDFPVAGTPAPATVEARWAHLVGIVVGSGKQVVVDPPQCGALFHPVTVQGGADRIGVGAEGPDGQLLSVGAYTPVSVPEAIPSGGCERMSFNVDDDAVLTQGSADRLAAPSIDGAATTAMRVNVDFWEFVEYYYVAILGGRTFVQVVARVHPEFAAEPLVSNLLVEGVAAIRGA